MSVALTEGGLDGGEPDCRVDLVDPGQRRFHLGVSQGADRGKQLPVQVVFFKNIRINGHDVTYLMVSGLHI